MKNIIVIFIVNLCLVCFSSCASDTLQYVTVETDISGDEKDNCVANTSTMSNIIRVHICGEVTFPGVYTLYADSRVYEVVQMAGGFTLEADTAAVNQAKEVVDGEQIYIPSIEESKTNQESNGLININSADESVLCTIPGIGATRAKQIIKYRDQHGSFKSIEDIMNVSGIKEGIFEKIAPYITVS